MSCGTSADKLVEVTVGPLRNNSEEELPEELRDDASEASKRAALLFDVQQLRKKFVIASERNGGDAQLFGQRGKLKEDVLICANGALMRANRGTLRLMD